MHNVPCTLRLNPLSPVTLHCPAWANTNSDCREPTRWPAPCNISHHEGHAGDTIKTWTLGISWTYWYAWVCVHVMAEASRISNHISASEQLPCDLQSHVLSQPCSLTLPSKLIPLYVMYKKITEKQKHLDFEKYQNVLHISHKTYSSAYIIYRYLQWVDVHLGKPLLLTIVTKTCNFLAWKVK